MIDLKKILDTLYSDKSHIELEKMLREAQLYNAFKTTVTQLNTLIVKEKELLKTMKVLPVGHIAANLLSTLNAQLKLIVDLDKKKKMESFLSSLSYQVLKSFLASITSPKEPLINHISLALHDTCSLNNYDSNQLFLLIDLKSELAYKRSQKNKDLKIGLPEITAGGIPSYIWNGADNNLKAFLAIFSEQKLMLTKKGITSLFNNPDSNLNLQFNPANADLVLQFFYTLKKKKLLKCSRSNGFYLVLNFHVLDFEKLFLKNKPAQKRINALRQNKTKWLENQKRIDKWLNNIN